MKTPGVSSSGGNNNIKKAIRQLVWNKYIGQKNGTGYCWCCNSTIINTFDFECGHVEARALGGPDTVENLRPICGLCNRSMGTCNMMEFRKKHGLDGSSQQTTWWSWLVLPRLLF